MEQKHPSYIEQIPRVDWEKTPASVQELVEGMGQQIESLKKQLAEVLIVQQQLEERANRTSKNSSSPPSADPPGFGNKQEKNKSTKKQGGQPGHSGHSRDLYPIEKCSSVHDQHPTTCRLLWRKPKWRGCKPLQTPDNRNSPNRTHSDRTPLTPIDMWAMWNRDSCNIT